MSSNTKIKFKRSANHTVENLDNIGERLEFGEPLLVNNGKYLVLGPAPESTNDANNANALGTPVSQSIFFKGMSRSDADHGVIYQDRGDRKVLVSQKTGSDVAAAEVYCSNVFDTSTINSSNKSDKYYLLCNNDYNKLYNFKLNTIGIYVDGNGVLHGAAWYDYAENREYEDEVIIDDLSGRVVCEDGHGKLKLSRERLQPCAYVVSDTFGITIGEGNIPVAVSGRVLVHIDDEVKLGDCVAAGFNGKAVKMTRQEIINYPDRILGTVIEIPDYDKFNDKNVDGRVWIRVK